MEVNVEDNAVCPTEVKEIDEDAGTYVPAIIEMLNALSVVDAFTSVARIVKLKDPAAEGVPLITPDEAFKEIPFGKEPDITEYVIDPSSVATNV